MGERLDRAFGLAREAIEAAQRIAAALERIAVAVERQTGSARPAKPPRKTLPAVAPIDRKRAESIARATGFKVLG